MKSQIQNRFRSEGARLLRKPFAKLSLVKTAGMMLDERGKQMQEPTDWVLTIGHLNVCFSFGLNSKLSLSVYHRLKGIAI